MTFSHFSSTIRIIRPVFAIIRPPSKTDFSSGRIIAKWPYFGEWSTSHLLFDSWVKLLTRFQKSVENYSAINYLVWEEIWENSGLYFFYKFGCYGWWPYHCEPPQYTFTRAFFVSFGSTLSLTIWNFACCMLIILKKTRWNLFPGKTYQNP